MPINNTSSAVVVVSRIWSVLTESIQIPPQAQSQPRPQPPPQHRRKAPGIKPSQKSSAQPHASGASCQRTDGASPASRIRTDECGSAPEASTTMPQPQLKTKTVLQRGPRPSPNKTAMRGAIHHTPQSSDDEDEFEDLAGFVATEEDKIEYVRAAARRKAEATGSEIPLLLDPKKILEYIKSGLSSLILLLMIWTYLKTSSSTFNSSSSMRFINVIFRKS